MKVAVLGATGLLGHTVAHYLSNQGYEVTAYSRNPVLASKFSPKASHLQYNFAEGLTSQSARRFKFTVNCIGFNNPKPIYVESALTWNTNLVFDLTHNPCFGKIIHISTDAVFSPYFHSCHEDVPHSCSNVYTMTKSLSESCRHNVMNFRCSIIGHEIIKRTNPSLLEWFLAQKGTVRGFLNHKWNGITALQYAKICKTVIDENLFFAGDTQHLVPADQTNKYCLLHLFKQVYRKKIEIIPENAISSVERILCTLNPRDNWSLWGEKLLTIKEMVEEMHEYNAKYGV